LTAREVHDQARWILPSFAALFVALAVLARIDALPWDRPITNWMVDQRTPRLNDLAKSVTQFGSETVVYAVAALCAVVAWPRCRSLAISIAVLAVSRPLIVAVLKEVVARDRPPATVQVIHPHGYSFPSGHPFATAASWCFIPLVIALYSQRRWIWWVSVFAVWTLVMLVAASRVYLGAHYASDVTGSLLLAPLFVFGSEEFIGFVHRRSATRALACGYPRVSSPRSHAPEMPTVRR
jgi:undecaprenyl-diphosphatase